MLHDVIQAGLPNAQELLTPPHRHGTDSTAAAAAGGPQHQQQLVGAPRPPYTLREGVGARRLARFRVAAGVQLLLVQAASAMYAQHYAAMAVSCSCAAAHGWCCARTALTHRLLAVPSPALRAAVPQPRAVVLLADCLALVGRHAAALNTDVPLRRRLAAQQAEDRVAEERQLQDPPLLRQETEAAHAYLSLLLHIASSSSSGGKAGAGPGRGGSLQWAHTAEVQQAVRVSGAAALPAGQERAPAGGRGSGQVLCMLTLCWPLASAACCRRPRSGWCSCRWPRWSALHVAQSRQQAAAAAVAVASTPARAAAWRPLRHRLLNMLPLHRSWCQLSRCVARCVRRRPRLVWLQPAAR